MTFDKVFMLTIEAEKKLMKLRVAGKEWEEVAKEFGVVRSSVRYKNLEKVMIAVEEDQQPAGGTAMAVLKSQAASAAAVLMVEAQQRLEEASGTPYIGLSGDSAEVKALVVEWFKYPDHLHRVANETNRPVVDLKEDLQYKPIVYGRLQAPGKSESLLPNKYIALIALQDLSQQNGFPRWRDSPSTLAQGYTAFFPGNETQSFLPHRWGGLALLLLFGFNVDHMKS
ncbi:MAG: hypothetical protein Q9198_006305 [Flavoplaca austrocitrina]